MTIKPILFLAVLTSLAACASPDPHNVGGRTILGEIKTQDDGKPAYFVNCDTLDNMTQCQDQAKSICLDKGYTTLKTQDGHFGSSPIWDLHRNMTIRCDTPDGLFPGDKA